MVTYLSNVLGPSCLSSMIWPFTLTIFTFGSCLYCANVSQYKDGWAVNLGFFSQRDTGIPKLNAKIVNNTSMKQNWWQLGWIVRLLKLGNLAQANTKMGGHLATTIFFSLAEKIGKLGKFASSVGISKNPGCHIRHIWVS